MFLAMVSTYMKSQAPSFLHQNCYFSAKFQCNKNLSRYIRNILAGYSLHFVPVIYIIYNSARCVVITLLSQHISGVENCREDRGRVFKRFSSWVQLGPVLSLSRPPGAKLQGFAGLTDFYPAYPLSSPSRCPDTGHNRLFRTTDFDSEV